MVKFITFTVLAVAIAAGVAYANQTNSKVALRVDNVSASSGQKMYFNYCAPCHGVDARGHGPVAPALKMPPTDLTVLSKNNNGKFPGAFVSSVLESGAPTPSHGTAEMPVWGPILGKMDKDNSLSRTLRISNLCRYLESVQSK